MEQVGVNAQGQRTTFLPANISSVVIGVGLPSCMLCKVAAVFVAFLNVISVS